MRSKRSFILMIFALAFSLKAEAQLNWVTQTSSCPAHNYNVDFIDENTGWVLGFGGYLLKTVNGGDSWTVTNITGSPQPNSLSFVNETHGWILDYNSKVLRTTDGGSTWVPVYYNPTSPWSYTIHFIDEQHGWLTRNDYVLYTENGGNDWDSVNLALPASGFDIQFADVNNGYVMAAAYKVARSIDGGVTWSLKTVDGTGTYSFNDMCVVNSTTLYIVGEDGLILYSADGGDNWIPRNSGTTLSLFGVDFYSATHGVVCGDQGLILTTSDGGITWVTNSSLTTEALYGVAVMSKVTAWTTGNNGTIRSAQPGSTDIIIEIYQGADTICQGDYIYLPFEVKNQGVTEQMSGTFVLTNSASDIIGIYPWNGSLMPSEQETITLGPVQINASDNYLLAFTGDTLSTTGNYYYFPLTVRTHEDITTNSPQTICPGESAELIVTGGENYLWLSQGPGDTLSTLTVSPPMGTSYPVQIGYDGQCKYTDTLVVDVDPGCLDAVSAFSPNGDGVNDYFHIEGAETFDNVVTIYNRWGDREALVTNYNNTDRMWDGEYLNAGIYYYTIEVTGTPASTMPQVMSGWVQLVR